MCLVKENKILKKKCNLLSTNETEAKVSTFLTTDSEYTSKNKENNSCRSNRPFQKK